MNTIGVDVDSKNLVCQIRRNGKDYPSATFSNDPVGHRRFVKWATKREQLARECMEAIPELNTQLTLITTTTGIATNTGPRILVELAAFPQDMTAAQWVAHAGLDPRPYESGVSTHKPRRITKAGNRYLRDALFFPALVASQKDKHVKAYYQHLLQKGKKPMQAIMRKLLLAIWGMLHHQQPRDGNKFYKLT